MPKKTHEEYVEELKIKNPTVEVVEKYIDSRTKIKHYCLLHDVYWSVAPTNVLRGCGCKKCGIQKVKNKLSITQEQYLKELEVVNRNILLLGTYSGANTPILHKCLIDETEWLAAPSSIKSGCGCPKCAQKARTDKLTWTHEKFTQELSTRAPLIEAIGVYKKSSDPMKFKCKVCGYTWETTAASILDAGTGCPLCARKKLSRDKTRSHDQYVEKLKAVNPNIEVIGMYIRAREKVQHKCLLCGYEWYATPDSILRGHGCPHCRRSISEEYIGSWLSKNGIVYEPQKVFDGCKDKKLLPFDFYLPDYNIVIEYDGEQHYRAIDFFGGEEHFEIRVRHDKTKDEYCEANNIRLFRIPYYADIETELNNLLA